jgi:hypothetical protein
MKMLTQRLLQVRRLPLPVRAIYLNDFERRLSKSLWALLWIGVIYAMLQHVILINIPELFTGGASVGDLIYDLALAYISAFLFYILVVSLPLQRSRRGIYRYLNSVIGKIVGNGIGLMDTLNQLAGTGWL